MNKLVIIMLVLVTVVACKPKININAEQLLKEQLKSENYFRLRSLYQKYSGHISEKLSLEIQAHLLNTFNKNNESNQTIHELIKMHEVSDSLKTELLLVQADNYLKLFEYKKAYDLNKLLLAEYKSNLDSARFADIKNMNNIFEPLQNTSPQKVLINEDNYIPIKRDIAGLMNVEVELKNSKFDFIFDTGAGISVIKQSLIKELGIELLETSIEVNSATGIKVKSSLAVIDTLKLGNIIVLNSVFLVLEDEMLEFPQANYFPIAAIGFPIMEEFNEFSITKTDTLIVPQKPTKGNFANMRLNGLSPNVFLYNSNDTLAFAFDTGAAKTHFTSKYYNKYKAHIESTAKADSVTSASAGGSKQHSSYLLDSCELHIGDQKAMLEKIHVHTELNKTFEDVYGNLGQDLIRQFNCMTLNFDDMYLKFE